MSREIHDNPDPKAIPEKRHQPDTAGKAEPPDWAVFRDGIDAPNSTQTPDVCFDLIFPFLSDVELRVLLYLIRRTFGFKKQSDFVSLHQLVDGIVTRDGKRLDYGTQLSRAGVTKGLRGLREKNLIIAEQQADDERGHTPTRYCMNIRSANTPMLRTEHSPATHGADPLLQGALPSAMPVAPQIDSGTRNRSTTNRSPLTPPRGGQVTLPLNRAETREQRRSREKAERERTKFTTGTYALCPRCGSRPCIPGCPGPSAV